MESGNVVGEGLVINPVRLLNHCLVIARGILVFFYSTAGADVIISSHRRAIRIFFCLNFVFERGGFTFRAKHSSFSILLDFASFSLSFKHTSRWIYCIYIFPSAVQLVQSGNIERENKESIDGLRAPGRSEQRGYHSV